MSTKDQLPSIDLSSLSQVTGGGARATTATPATSTDDVTTALTGILSSLQSIAGQPHGGGFSQQEMLLFMMMMQQQRNQAPVAVAASPWSPQPIIRYY
jgi:hypothetical protein